MATNFKELTIRGEYITLGQAMKALDFIASGGEVKSFLTFNKVYVNNELENRRGKKLYPGDFIIYEENKISIK